MEISNLVIQWSPVISGIGSLFLSTALVWLYYQQKELDKKQFNREIRSKHTDILKERIRYWLGHSITDSSLENSTNLPHISGATVVPAPSEESIVGQNEFRVVPERIENDRYLKDLLNNHAEDLNQLKESIEEKYEEYESLKEQFTRENEGGETIEKAKYTLKPINVFKEGIFKQAVLVYRDTYHDKEKLKDIAKDGATPTSTGDSTVVPGVSEAATNRRFSYKIEVEDKDYYSENHEEMTDEARKILVTEIENIGEDRSFGLAREAASILDEMQEEIRELEHVLIEYEGKPLYQGSCHYIEETEI